MGRIGFGLGLSLLGIACAASPAAPAPTDGYPQWWSSMCKTSGGGCTDPSCSPATLMVSPTRCGGYQTIHAGCLPIDRVTDGWACVIRTSDGQVILTEDYPAAWGDPTETRGAAGLEPCDEAGVTNGPGDSIPACPDGGGP